MLASFVVSLSPLAPARLHEDVGDALHGLFYTLVRQGDVALAAHLHVSSSVKPFTISPLRGRFGRTERQRIAMPEQTYWVRYTTLSDEVFSSLNASLSDKYVGRQAVMLYDQPFEITDIRFEPYGRNHWARITTVADIWQTAALSPTVALRFCSPTAFRQRGLSLLFPIPFNVFQSYREKWLSVGGEPIGEDFLQWVDQHVAVEAHKLRTRYVHFNEFGLRGFTGWVRYNAQDQNALRLKQLNVLADFAFFGGTGMKTTQGLGQTRRWPEGERRPK